MPRGLPDQPLSRGYSPPLRSQRGKYIAGDGFVSPGTVLAPESVQAGLSGGPRADGAPFLSAYELAFSRKTRKTLLREGWRSLRSDFDSI